MCGIYCFFFFQAEDGIRDLVRSRGLGDVYKRQALVSKERVDAGTVGKADYRQANNFNMFNC